MIIALEFIEVAVLATLQNYMQIVLLDLRDNDTYIFISFLPAGLISLQVDRDQIHRARITMA